jgi:hypothetical protein
VRLGDAPKDLLFGREAVELYLRDKRAGITRNTWSLSEAAKFIYCDPLVLPTVISEGLLDAVEVSTGMRVTEKSVRNFDTKFVSVAKLAKRLGTSSRRLQKTISKNNIPLIAFRRGYGKVDQPFVSLEHEEALIEILELHGKQLAGSTISTKSAIKCINADFN